MDTTSARTTEHKALPRRWPQFGLKAMLLIVFACAVASLWLAVSIRRAKERRESVLSLEKLGAEIIYRHQRPVWNGPINYKATHPGPGWLREKLGDAFFDRVAEVYLLENSIGGSVDSQRKAITDADLASLRGLGELRALTIQGYFEVTDNGLAPLQSLGGLEVLSLNMIKNPGGISLALKGLTRLRKLSLQNMHLNDAALEHVGTMTRLEDLQLNVTDVGDEGLAHISGLENLQRLGLNATKVTDHGLKHLSQMQDLRELALISSPGVTATGLQELSAHGKLSILHLGGPSITDEGVQKLAPLANLEELSLGRARITDAGLRGLEALTKLEVLDLSHTQITGAGLSHLRGLTCLRSLRLSGTSVTSAGLANLASFAGLEQLYLDGCPIGDESTAHLVSLRQLKELSLSRTLVSDAALTELQQLPKLERIEALDSRITREGAAAFRKARPKCSLMHY